MNRSSLCLALLSAYAWAIPVDGTAQGTAITSIGNDRLEVGLTSWGLIGAGADGASPAFEVPPGAGAHVLWGSGLWVTGRGPGDALHAAGADYGGLFDSDYWTGPLTTDGSATALPGVAQAYDRIWCVERFDIEQHLNFHDCVDDPDCDEALVFPGYQPAQSLIDWPAMGDIALGLDPYQAPFVDRDGDGAYDPDLGDVPCILGDRACFMVLNDQRPHSFSQGLPLGIELRLMPFVFDTNDPELANTLFLRAHVINRSSNAYTDVRIGLHTDFDLGDPEDDMIGTDPSRNLWFAYNGDGFDGPSIWGPGFGGQPPAFGVRLIKGPLVEADGNDDPVVPLIPGFNGQGFADQQIDNERFGLTGSRYYTTTSGATGVPQSAVDVERYLAGQWLDGLPQTYGGNGYSLDPNATPARFVYPGDSDPLGAGTDGAAQAPWSEVSEGNTPGDRRMVGVTGPFVLESGEHADLLFAYLFAQAPSGGPLASVTALQAAADSALVNVIGDVGGMAGVFGIAEENALSVCAPHLVTVGLVDHRRSMGVQVFPNPATDQLVVLTPGTAAGAELTLRDASGRLVRAMRTTGERSAIDVSDLAKGVYLCEVTDRGARFTGMLVKE
ncbi:MAG TPA: T9SS type A sorting domain-containing protein [Flavobacteriales bacterium]|nr:T9SS type A sorting domain-containing protein [Flavobacteriales bacterium]HMR27338.1 T9SS type A sorting domain-containing protein [Flavobacteriales bacterium]